VIKTEVVGFNKFFKILNEALKDNRDVKKKDDPFTLRCGFIIEGAAHYLMPLSHLKYANDSGINVGVYSELSD
jgi:hypothetical protein